MASLSEKLAESLETLKRLQLCGNIVRSSDLSRTHKERLVKTGFLQEIINGWYIVCRPDSGIGNSASWYTTFWEFISVYLNTRFGSNWWLSPEQSLLLHAGNNHIPRQLIVRSPLAGNNNIQLKYGTSVFDFKSNKPKDIITKDNLQILPLAEALIESTPDFFIRHPLDARTVLSMIQDSSEVLPHLLEGGHSVIAGRLIGAFNNIGRKRVADDISKTMKSAGYVISANDPFEVELPTILDVREISPYVNRIKLMWQQMREAVADNFPKPPDVIVKSSEYLKQITDIYVNDAYNSLSIEGYNVTEKLIEKVRKGNWNPDKNDSDKEQLNAVAARGYWQAFQSVKISIKEILKGGNPGIICSNDHGNWYRELFSPGVTAGILRPSDLAGYRNDQVYINGSMHVPLRPEAVRDAMPAFFDLLKEENDPLVRAVLGHFIFVYIHPYMDGNGRIARFLMNAMLASGGYKWTIIPVDKRLAYMECLEKASIDNNIVPFTKFISGII